LRSWRRLHGGSDGQLDDNTDLMWWRTVRPWVKAWAAENGVPLVFCKGRGAQPPDRRAAPRGESVALRGWFRIRLGRLQLKAYTKSKHLPRFEATVHNTKELRCRRSLEHFDQIISLLARMAAME
jgi:hypothetical protein